jgi:hypothetical protein
MNEGTRSSARAEGRKPQPRRVRLPGFVAPKKDVGLGRALQRATSTVGISRPCGGCAGRAAALNRWMVFSGRRPR